MSSGNCVWQLGDRIMEDYHDAEWGKPLHEDNRLFELFVLSGFQAGLSWKIILHKRSAFRAAFAGFDPALVAAFTDRDKEALLHNEAIIRNKVKIAAAIHNAACVLRLQQTQGSFDRYLWAFTDGKVIDNGLLTHDPAPTRSALSDMVSAALLQQGFKFAGTTICYAFLQSIGMVNDHLIDCSARH